MPTLTFDEFPVWTRMPQFELTGDGDGNIVFTGGVIMADSASDQSPVLGGVGGNFGEPVSARFVNPVQEVSLRVGHIGSPGSTAVRFYDATGALLSEQVVETEGFSTVTYTATLAGIASVEAVPLSNDPAGFAIDNLTLGDHFVFPQPDIEINPDDFHPFTDEEAIRHLGNASEIQGLVLRDRIGYFDFEDTFSVDFEHPTDLTIQLVMDRSPNIAIEVTLSFDAGRHYFEVTTPTDPEYTRDEPYTLYIGGMDDISDEAAARAHQAGINVGQTLFKAGAIDINALATAIASANIRNSAEALKYYEGLGKGLGKAAIFLDILFRIDDVLNSDDPGRELFIQTVDLLTGILFAWAGTQIGAGVGLTFAGIGAGVGAPVGGFTAGMVYSFAISDEVQASAGEFWDDNIEPSLPQSEPLQAAAIAEFIQSTMAAAAENVQAVTFDPDWYLNTYDDAMAAVESGQVPSAYAHFVLYGAELGYLPHEGGETIDPTTLVGYDVDATAIAGSDYRNTHFQAEVRTMAGDGLSAAENAVVSAISTLRSTSMLYLSLDPDLMAIAHRKAMDLVHDPYFSPRERALLEDPNWEDTWADGSSFREGIANIPTEYDDALDYDPWLITNAYVNGDMIVAVALSDDPDPDAVMAAFMADPETRYLVSNPNIQTMGIAEYGGVWVLIGSIGLARGAIDRTITETPLIERSGGDGADHMALGTWQGALDGGAGNDTLTGGASDDTLRGDAGNDSLLGGDGVDVLVGGTGDDTLTGGTSEDDLRDLIYAGEGDDLLDGGYGNDELRGDAGGDTIVGGFGVDDIFGGDGNDELTGQAWSDLIFGGAGDDFINGGFGFDRVNGGTGADRFFHLGIADHGSDWIQDYNAAEGDVLHFGQVVGLDQFRVNVVETTGAGTAGVRETFVSYVATGEILWALVDGEAQTQINLLMGGVTYDLLTV